MHTQETQDRNYIKYLEDQNNRLHRDRLWLLIWMYASAMVITVLAVTVVVG